MGAAPQDTKNDPRGLWKEALDSLSETDRAAVPTGAANGAEDLLCQVVQEQTKCRGKKIQIKGKDIIISEIFARIYENVQKFVQVGDIVAQCDPVHAALPWAAIRLILQACTSNYEKHAIVLEGIEHISQTLPWAKLQEAFCLSRPSKASQQTRQALVNLYADILCFLVKAIRFYSKSSAARVGQSLWSFASPDPISAKISKGITEIELYFPILLEERNQDLSDDIKNYQDTLIRRLSEMEKPLDRVEVTTELCKNFLLDGKQEKIMEWISDIPYEKHQTEAYKKVLQGTGKWVLESDTFLGWRVSCSSQILWLHGMLGSGKSSLVSIVIHHLLADFHEDGASQPAYFYCVRNSAEPRRSDPTKIICSILSQLIVLNRPKPTFDKIQKRFESRREKGDLSLTEATNFLIEMLSQRDVTYILIDALDECDPNKLYDLNSALLEIINSSSSIVKIFLSSRNEQEMMATFGKFPNLEVGASNNISDISTFIHEKVDELILSKRLLRNVSVPDSLRGHIKATLCNKAEGMFRWAELQLQFLCTFKTISAIKHQLGTLPRDLNEIYDKVYSNKIDSLDPEERIIAKNILRWLLCEQHPLTVPQLSSLLAVEMDVEEETEFLTAEQILDLTCGFAILDRELGIFRLCHLSVAEYLESRHEDFTSEINNEVAAAACLKVLLNHKYETNPISKPKRTLASDLALNQKTAFDYAKWYWIEHLARSEKKRVESRLQPLVSQFLEPKSQPFADWSDLLRLQMDFSASAVYSSTDSRSYEQRILKNLMIPPSAAFIACEWGILEVLQELIRRDSSLINGFNRGNNSLLFLASIHGHTEIMSLLLSAGARVDDSSDGRETALMGAALYNKLEAVQLLINHGANLNLITVGGTALRLACRTGSKELIKLLIDRGADVNGGNSQVRGSALTAASTWGRAELAEILLESGADVHNNTSFYGSSLIEAASRGHESTVRVLLKYGADVHAYRESALDWAIFGRHNSTVGLLIEHGANLSTILKKKNH